MNLVAHAQKHSIETLQMSWRNWRSSSSSLRSNRASPAATQRPHLHGGLIDLEAMRADVAAIAFNASKAAILSSSLDFRSGLDRERCPALRQRCRPDMSLDAMSEHFQTAINEAREDERRKLAREIHDGPAQVLTNAIYAVQIVEQIVKRNPAAVEEEIGRLREPTQGRCDRDSALYVRSAADDAAGLRPGANLAAYVDDYGRFFGRRATCTSPGTLPPLTPDQELHVFRDRPGGAPERAQARGQRAGVDVSMTGGRRTT